jgi:hypothetical protein
MYCIYPKWKCSPSFPFFVDELGKNVTNLELCIVPILVIIDLQPVGIFYKREM